MGLDVLLAHLLAHQAIKTQVARGIIYLHTYIIVSELALTLTDYNSTFPLISSGRAAVARTTTLAQLLTLLPTLVLVSRKGKIRRCTKVAETTINELHHIITGKKPKSRR